MKWYRYIFLVITIFMFCPTFIKADNGCSNSEIVKYQELAKNINVTYDYIEENGQVIFKVKINNLTPGLIVKDISHDKIYKYSSNEIMLPDNFYQGNSYKFYIYIDNDCSNKKVYSKYITLPYYNNYYNSSLCEGIEEFKYCQKWVKTISTGSEFEKQIISYKESLKEKHDLDEKNKEYKGLLYEISLIYLKYYFIILPIFIITGIMIIIKINKKQDLF